MRISNPKVFSVMELQMFINGVNKASNSYSGNTVFTTAGTYRLNSLSKINNGVLSNDQYHSEFSTSAEAIGNNCGVNLNGYFSKYDIESIIIYQPPGGSFFTGRITGVTIELLNTNDNVRVSSTKISSAKLYYRFDGPRIADATTSTSVSATAVINDSSNTESLTEVADLDTLDYLFSKVRVIITSLVASNGNDPRCRELQMFINDDNKMIGNDTFASPIRNPANINDANLTTANVFFFATIGDHFGINFNNSYFSKYDIQSIVYYNQNSGINEARYQTIELLNANDNIRVSSSQISLGKLYYRFDGPRIGDATLSSSASTIAVIDDSSNTESLTGL